MRQVVVVGLGNRYRRDDGVASVVLRRLRELAPPGVTLVDDALDPLLLMERWDHEDVVILVDAMTSGARPGSVRRFDGLAEPLPPDAFAVSTHALGVAAAVELAGKLNRLPAKLIVFGVEADDLGTGEGLSPEVTRAVGRVTREVLGELRDHLGAETVRPRRSPGPTPARTDG